MGLFDRGARYQMRNRGWLVKGSNELFATRLVGVRVAADMSNSLPNIVISIDMQQ